MLSVVNYLKLRLLRKEQSMAYKEVFLISMFLFLMMMNRVEGNCVKRDCMKRSDVEIVYSTPETACVDEEDRGKAFFDGCNSCWCSRRPGHAFCGKKRCGIIHVEDWSHGFLSWFLLCLLSTISSITYSKS